MDRTTEHDGGKCTSSLSTRNASNLGLVSVFPSSDTLPFLQDQEYKILLIPGFESKILSRLIHVGQHIFDIASCTVGRGEGAPWVHIPMHTLTDHVSETMTVESRLNTALSLTSATTAAEPVPRPSSSPKQTSVAQPSQSSPQLSVLSHLDSSQPPSTVCHHHSICRILLKAPIAFFGPIHVFAKSVSIVSRSTNLRSPVRRHTYSNASASWTHTIASGNGDASDSFGTWH